MKIYNTMSRSKEELVPLTPGEIKMYSCGVTVYDRSHVGHARMLMVFDVMARYLRFAGYRVTFVRNFTDIDDKIIRRAGQEGVSAREVSERNIAAFREDMAALGVLPPEAEPRATEHVPEMIALVGRLIASGHAYVVDGDVYFAVRSFPAYGKLSGKNLDELQAGARVEVDERKRDPRDFALWKAAKPGEPETAAWDTPYGRGRPGWHLECSAMAGKYLGDEFDIHGGGLDLRFPHHENELAQSSAIGRRFARTWMHNGLVTAAGEKMSKSLGNGAIVRNVVERVRPVELRYYLVAAHYRSAMEFSEVALEQAATTYQRIEGFVRRAAEQVGDVDVAGAELAPGFVAGMDDDLGVPAALAALQGVIREGNKHLDEGDLDAVREDLASVRAMLDVLGLDPLAEPWVSRSGTSNQLSGVVDGLVSALLEQRAAARERKDYAAADAIRDRLKELGVVVEDTPAGPRWTVGGTSGGAG